MTTVQLRLGTDCVLWTGGKTLDGYGQFREGGRSVYAHRRAYELAHGPIAPGMVVDHLCRNRACVNPEHLEAVSNRENLMRGDTIPARNRAKAECPKGHRFDGVEKTSGKRYCKQCKADAARRRYHARTAA